MADRGSMWIFLVLCFYSLCVRSSNVFRREPIHSYPRRIKAIQYANSAIEKPSTTPRQPHATPVADSKDYHSDSGGLRRIIPVDILVKATTPKHIDKNNDGDGPPKDSTQMASFMSSIVSSSSSSSLALSRRKRSSEALDWSASANPPTSSSLIPEISSITTIRYKHKTSKSVVSIITTSSAVPTSLTLKENKSETDIPVLGNQPKALRFLGHYPIHDMDYHQHRLWLERIRKGRGSLSVEGTFLWTCGLMGTAANGAVFLTAAISRYFRKPLHIMVSSLALLDLYVTFIYIPSYTYFLVERNRDLDDKKSWSESIFSYCNVTRGIFLFCASMSITIQIFIALYLFIMTCSKDLAHKVFNTRNTFIYITVASFANLFTLFTPTFFGYPRVDFYPNGHLCSPETHEAVGDWTLSNFRVLYHCSALTLHITELLLICFFILNIFLAVVRGKLVRIKYGRRDRMANMNYSRAIHITIVVFSCFMLLWLPLYTVNFVDPNHELIPDAVHHLVFDLLLIKSCFNPLIYIYAIKSLRFELRLMCLCKFTAEERRKALTPPKKTTTSYDGPSSAETSSYGF